MSDRMSGGGSGPKRILVISDSIGTPIHPRGIYHYTANFIRALASCGHHVTLLVETTGYSEAQARKTSPLESISEYLASRYFVGEYPFGSPSWTPYLKRFRVPTRLLALVSAPGAAVLLRRPVPGKAVPHGGTFRFPDSLGHLHSVSEFKTSPRIYTLSFTTSALNLPAPFVDACGYDVILVDTPSYIRFKTSPGSRICAVIHDLIPLTDDTTTPVGRRSFRNKLQVTLTEATDYIFVSRATSEQVAKTFPAAVRGKTTAILHPTVSGHAATESPATDAITSRPTYVLAILSDEPRKNLEGIVRALPQFPPGVRLKVIGHYADDRQAWFTALDPRVEFQGYVSDNRKQSLLAESLGLIMPSLSEGFGIPLIEAAFQRKPVFCSDIPVFHEVMGENAFYFDPYSPASIAAAIGTYLADPASHRDRIECAYRECERRFTLAALEKAVGDYFGRDGRSHSV